MERNDDCPSWELQSEGNKKDWGKSYVLYDVDKWLSGYCYDCIFGCGLRLIISVSKLCGRDSVI